ncbi:hypothetical protein GT755_05780 [Herbidospora sp. NEAU-GS84]|uniref:MFS transporter n=1 Tax=Herbidospora solisilvae TaxID=2696284 RepID=A0A7C9NCN0_9ACTN|nr:hypothetical protein [Herbidospora solisilvae]NAS21195.1 hypothetical protein [Herbidospora solisilvae]
MAVPPFQPALPQRVRALAVDVVRLARRPVVTDAVVAMLIAVALPLAIVSIPNTISQVAALLPPGVSQIDMMRAHGLALPVMLLTVPLAAVAVRRFKAAPVLVLGLAMLAAADAGGGYADGPALVGVLRVVHGVGAGLLIPATLVAAGERRARRGLLALWAGMLAVSLVTAQALALWPIDNVRSWAVTLQPFPLLTGLALSLAAVYLVLWRLAWETTAAATDRLLISTPPGSAERSRLLMAAVPSAGIAVLAVGTTFDWPSGLVVAVAGLALVAMLGLAVSASTAGARTLGFTCVAVGLVVLPTAAQVTYVEMPWLGGPGLDAMGWPLVVSVIGTLGAVWVAGRAPEEKSTKLVGAGLVVLVVGLCAIRVLVPAADGLLLAVPFTLMAAGAAVALVSALRLAGPVAALFGLALLFPAMLAGFLLGTGIQVTWLRSAAPSGMATYQGMVDGFVEALHVWALVGGFGVVLVLGLSALSARRANRVAAAEEPKVVVPAPTPSPEVIAEGDESDR